MNKADQFSFPMAFTGDYPNNWAGYVFLQKTEQDAYHPGIDWNWGAGEEDYGRPIQAIANGICVHISTESKIGYGTISVLKHELTDELISFIKTRYNIDSQILYSFYAHQKAVNIKEGQEVERGDLIGYCGKTGTSVSHLHQELYKPIPGTTWRYWPTLKDGWDQERLKQYYIDTYDLVINQPQLAQQNDLQQCKEQLTQEIKWKNETYQELVEFKNNLEASQSENLTHQNYIKQLAITLSVEPDTAKILGQITKLLAQEDQLREAIKKAQDLESSLTGYQKSLEEKTGEYLSAFKEKQALQSQYNDLQELYKELQENYQNILKLQKISFKRLFWKIYYGQEVIIDGNT